MSGDIYPRCKCSETLAWRSLWGFWRLKHGHVYSSPDQVYWQKVLGVDIEHVDEWEIVRRSEFVNMEKVTHARQWLEKMCKEVKYDGNALTSEKLKGQPELTNYFCTMDLTEAFLNDPYDWDEPPAFTRFNVDPDELIETYCSNHIHGVYGDFVQELILVCKMLGINYHVYA